LNLSFIEDLLQRKHKMHPGLPDVGEYDTLQGVYNTSDIFWKDRFGNPREVQDSDKFTSITNRPIPVYHRKDDTLTEYRKETTPQFHPELGVYTPPSDEKSKRQNQLLPLWFSKVDWDQGMRDRPDDLHVPPIFTSGSEKQMDQFEDNRLLCQKAYWDTLMLRNIDDVDELREKLRLVFREFTDFTGDKHEYDFDAVLKNVESAEDKFTRAEFREKLWEVYEDFWNRMKHYHEMHHQSSKINFDSGLRKLREDMTKWRYMVIDDENDYNAFRGRLETTVPDPEMREKLHRAHQIYEEIEKMFRSQRVGIPTLHQFISQIDEDTMKIFFTWSEQLAESGEEIAYGKGWSFNDYIDIHTPSLQYDKMPVMDHPMEKVNSSFKRQISKLVAAKNAKRGKKRLMNDMQAHLQDSFKKNEGRMVAMDRENRENMMQNH